MPAPCFLCSDLPRRVVAATAVSRSRASSTSVPIDAYISDVELLPSPFPLPSPRVDTGTNATSDSSGSASWRSRYRRAAPPTAATMTSLIVTPARDGGAMASAMTNVMIAAMSVFILASVTRADAVARRLAH